MISRKELGYVNLFARYAPFPGVNYAAMVMDELIRAYQLFNEVYLDKEFSFIFSDGEEINFELLNKNLAHMLGIDFKNLLSGPLEETMYKVLGFTAFENKSSYEILTRIIERADEVIKNDSNPSNFKILNYYKSMIKCAIFLQLSQFNKFNFGCINFDRDYYNANNETEFSPQSTKLFFTQSHEAITPYFMMGLKYSEQNGKYIPETLFAPTNFAEFFRRQELVVPTQILTCTNDELTKLTATSEEKLQLLNLYKSIISTYGTQSYINIFNDYENMLMGSREKVKVIK